MRPYLLKDIIVLENVRRRGTKFILNDFTADYKTRLLSLNLLPLAMLYELNDILFFIKSLKKPTAAFHILDYVSFCSNSTRSASFTKLVNKSARTNTINHSYFYRLPRLWNSLPPIDLSLSFYSIKRTLKQFFWDHFVNNFNSCNYCSFHYLCPCYKCVDTRSVTFK